LASTGSVCHRCTCASRMGRVSTRCSRVLHEARCLFRYSHHLHMPPRSYDLNQDACLSYYSIDLWCLFTLITLGNAVRCLKCVVRWYIHHALENAIQVYPYGILMPTGNGGRRAKHSKRLFWPAFFPKKLTRTKHQDKLLEIKIPTNENQQGHLAPVCNRKLSVDRRLGHSNHSGLLIYAKGVVLTGHPRARTRSERVSARNRTPRRAIGTYCLKLVMTQKYMP